MDKEKLEICTKLIVFFAYEIFTIIMCYIYVDDLIFSIVLPLIVAVALIYILTSE